MTIKFGGKQTLREKVAVASKNKNPAGAKDIKPLPKVKITPSGTNPLKKKIGVKVKWKF